MEPIELEDLLTANYPPVPSILGRGIIPHRGRVFLFGRYGSWKSMLALNLGMSLARGKSWLTFASPETPTNVLYLQCELPREELQIRARAMATSVGQPDGVAGKFYLWTEPYIKLDQNAGHGLLDRWIAALKPALIIVDPIYKVLSGDLLKYADVAPFLDRMDRLIDKHKVAIMLVCHPRKGLADEFGADDMMGSSLFPDWADTIIRVSKMGGASEHEAVKLEFEKVRYASRAVGDLIVAIDRRSLTITASEISIWEERT